MLKHEILTGRKTANNGAEITRLDSLPNPPEPRKESWIFEGGSVGFREKIRRCGRGDYLNWTLFSLMVWSLAPFSLCRCGFSLVEDLRFED